jgi:hypothetical protein
MATLYIEEYQSLPTDSQGTSVPAAGLLVANQQVTSVSASSQVSALFNTKTTFVMITADVAAQIEFGVNPTAASTSTYLPADVPRPFAVQGRGLYKVAVRTQA